MPLHDPLTEAEILRIKRWLGYPATPSWVDARLAGMSGALVAEASALYDRIVALEAAEDTSATRSALYERVEEIEFRGAEGTGMIAAQRTRLIRQLSLLLDIALEEGAMVGGGYGSGFLVRG